MIKNKTFIYYPYIIAVFPIINLYEQNTDVIEFSVTYRSMSIVLFISSIIYMISSIMYKSFEKGAVLTSVVITSFFSYSHIVATLPQTILGLSINPPIIGYYLIIGLISSVAALLILIEKMPRNVTRFGNTVSIILLFLFIYNLNSKQVFSSEKQIQELYKDRHTVQQELNAYNLQVNRTDLRDVYYIVLDGRARSEYLIKNFEYDDSAQLAELEKYGFKIARKSTSNYAQTLLSIASSLNLNYLDHLAENLAKTDNRLPLQILMNENLVKQFLESMGYQTQTISGGFAYLYEQDSFERVDKEETAKSFETILLSTTPLVRPVSHSIHDTLGKDITAAFKQVKEVTENKSPTFAHVHILSPHPPFIFTEAGEPLSLQDNVTHNGDGDHFIDTKDVYLEGYTQQVKYIDRKLLETVKYIIENSDPQPIIIIQSDHGSGYNLYWEDPEKTDLKERHFITNWYYLPGIKTDDLPESITPVNSFRYIFNKYYGTNLELLPDKNYFSKWSRPYELIDVTQDVQEIQTTNMHKNN